MRRTLLVPAAGRGTRLGAGVPKALVSIADRPMLEWILARHAPYCERVVLVVHPDDRAAFEAHLRGRPAVSLAEQAAPTGMLDAILAGWDPARRDRSDRVWITWCDQLLISRHTVDRLAACDLETPVPDAVFPTAEQTPPYIHFDRGVDGRLTGVRQRREGDEMPPTGESDAGLFSLSVHAMRELEQFARSAPPGSGTGERNFLPFFPWLARHGHVLTFPVPAIETLGVNTPGDLARAEQRLRSSG